MSGPFGLEMGIKKDQVKIAEEIAPYTYGLINVPKPHSAFPSIIGIRKCLKKKRFLIHKKEL